MSKASHRRIHYLYVTTIIKTHLPLGESISEDNYSKNYIFRIKNKVKHVKSFQNYFKCKENFREKAEKKTY